MSDVKCACDLWARRGEAVVTKHHSNCDQYSPLEDCRELIEGLVKGMVAWAGDEDGIHPAAWEAFQRGAISIGRSDLIIDGDLHEIDQKGGGQ